MGFAANKNGGDPLIVLEINTASGRSGEVRSSQECRSSCLWSRMGFAYQILRPESVSRSNDQLPTS